LPAQKLQFAGEPREFGGIVVGVCLRTSGATHAQRWQLVEHVPRARRATLAGRVMRKETERERNKQD
jgi:hypothetical protein